jgi:hypothetical protein
MRHTLKAVFAHRSDAEHVLDELLAFGYSRADTARSSALATGQAGCSVLEGDDAAVGGSGQHKDEAAYSGALMHARYAVTLAADSGRDFERAVAIIEGVGPVSIEVHDDELAQGSVHAGTDVLGTRSAYPPGTEPGALQGRAHEGSRYFGTQSAYSPPTGNTFAETMGADSQWVHPDDGRLHVPTPAPFADPDGAAHADYMAAYRYGKEMHTSDRYRNRSWDEAELGLSSGWEARATGTPAWDESRPAIRRGWDAVAPEIDDDGYYRNHWTTRYAGSAGDAAYDDYEPAYIYGSEARRSENYRSKDWRDVEPELAAAWKARHAGQLSSWENFKDAVNHGWNRISPDMDDASHDSVDAASDDDLPAAARHDPDAARDIDHRGHHRNEVDDHLKSDWERIHAGKASPTWDKLKAAVRHGWDRVRS